MQNPKSIRYEIWIIDVWESLQPVIIHYTKTDFIDLKDDRTEALARTYSTPKNRQSSYPLTRLRPI